MTTAQAGKALLHQNKGRYDALLVQIWLYEDDILQDKADTCLQGQGKQDDL